MEQQNYSATGRRKEAVARVEMKPGKGKFTVNGKQITSYLTRETLVNHAQRPLEITEMAGKVDVRCVSRGGGLSGQAGAIRHAIARALVDQDESLRSTMRQGGFLTRDAREVERKKIGLHKARKRPQYSKR